MRLIRVVAKTPEAAMHAKTLVENAADAFGGDDGVIAAPLMALEKFDALRVPQLRAELKRLSLPSSGTKQMLIARLAAHEDDDDDAIAAPDGGVFSPAVLNDDATATWHVDDTNSCGGDDAVAASDADAMHTVLLTASEQLYSLGVDQLRAGLTCYNLSFAGNKRTLIARLAAHANDGEDGVEASLSCLSFCIPEYAVSFVIGEKGSVIKRLQAGE
jgi:hypothetical protein